MALTVPQPVPLVPEQRLASLDGLRGLAALVVVVHHAMLVSPGLAEAYLATGSSTGAARWLAHTPLHLFWAGGEAVLVFFVLSGFVLTSAVLSPVRGPWLSYYAKRLPRLYLPVWAALIPALVLAASISRADVGTGSWWLNAHDPAGLKDVVGGTTLLIGPTFSLNSALWSLRWEVIFSLLLPLFVLVAVRWRQLFWYKAGVLVALPALTADSLPGWGTYLPIFGLGVLMAVERQRLEAAAGWCRTDLRWAVVGAGTVTLLLAQWLFPGAWDGLPGQPQRSLSALGAVLVVFSFLHCTALSRSTQNRACRWLGQRSFSLYLIHEPVVVAVAFLFDAHLIDVLLVAVPASLIAAEVFYRTAERPSHRVAAAAGRLAAARRAPDGPRTAAANAPASGPDALFCRYSRTDQGSMAPTSRTGASRRRDRPAQPTVSAGRVPWDV